MDMSEQGSQHNSTKSLQSKTQTSCSASSTHISRSTQSHNNRKYGSHSDTETRSSDEEKIISPSCHRQKSKERLSKKRSHRSQSRSNDKKRSRQSRSHSPRNGSNKNDNYFASHNYFVEKKANIKQQRVGGTIQVNPQQLLQKSMDAQVKKMKMQTGIELLSYNPVAVNPTNYAEHVQKGKLLWVNKQNNIVKQVEECKPTMITTNKAATIWQSTQSGDQDGKVTAKFKRLMVTKNNEIGVDNQTTQQEQSKDITKKQEEMLCSMESQYEVAHLATHKH